jgi:hypothetical protein
MLDWFRRIFSRPEGRPRTRKPFEQSARQRVWNRLPKIKLSYFDEVLAVEHDAINKRRAKLAQAVPPTRSGDPIRALMPEPAPPGSPPRPTSAPLPEPRPRPETSVNANKPILARMRPKPIPCTAVGLALSGGGIRSAAFSLGALQALDFHKVLPRIDYLSSVSGGGYTGASMTAGMSVSGGAFPFGGGNADVRDNDAIGHIRNYSNYLLPSARSGLRNVLDIAAILLRGLLANAILILAFLIVAALITYAGFPKWHMLPKGNFVPSVLAGLGSLVVEAMPDLPTSPTSWFGSVLSAWVFHPIGVVVQKVVLVVGAIGSFIEWMFTSVATLFGVERVVALFGALYTSRFGLTAILATLLALTLVAWAWRRSVSVINQNDVDSRSLRVARWLLGLTLLSAILDLQPQFIYALERVYAAPTWPAVLSPTVLVGAVVVALFARRLAAFLETTEVVARGSVRVRRLGIRALFVAAGLVLPSALFVLYWHLCAWIIIGGSVTRPSDALTMIGLYWLLLALFIPLIFAFKANAYSLHQLYKDRLAKAFLFEPVFEGKSEPNGLPGYKLSDIKTIDCPYPIINTALNVQGSKEANRRSRDADFFTFTPDLIGSDLTHFAPTGRGNTTNMERVDPRLDLGATMAISGAALSANMGSNTSRWLSPTLALLNIRLGYWLRNPRDLAKRKRVFQLREWVFNFFGKFYLLLEMFNVLDEERRFVYLSDGGHIENLGIYQLLKRGCRLIIAIDAEADPQIACPSLLKLERFARIDFGVRMILPWEQIAARHREVNRAMDSATSAEPKRRRGPHSAVGRVLYEDGSQAVLLYFKSSLSGDEKDYLLDYKKRNMEFPHETTSDQFFTEEQFECYRALGYHTVEGFFSNTDECSVLKGGHGAWNSDVEGKNEVLEALGLPLWRETSPIAPERNPPPAQNEDVTQAIAAQ